MHENWKETSTMISRNRVPNALICERRTYQSKPSACRTREGEDQIPPERRRKRLLSNSVQTSVNWDVTFDCVKSNKVVHIIKAKRGIHFEFHLWLKGGNLFTFSSVCFDSHSDDRKCNAWASKMERFTIQLYGGKVKNTKVSFSKYHPH